jgi:predicted membrane GTPase involved in stress response
MTDPYVGTLYLGRVHSGVLRPGDALVAIDPQGNKVGDGRVKKIYVRVVSIPFPLPMEKP